MSCNFMPLFSVEHTKRITNLLSVDFVESTDGDTTFGTGDFQHHRALLSVRMNFTFETNVLKI